MTKLLKKLEVDTKPVGKWLRPSARTHGRATHEGATNIRCILYATTHCKGVRKRVFAERVVAQWNSLPVSVDSTSLQYTDLNIVY